MSDNKHRNVACFFQYMLPDPFATSLRCDSFIKALNSVKDSDVSISVFTTTQFAYEYPSVVVHSVKPSDWARSNSSVARFLSEIFLGLKLSKIIFFSKKKYDLLHISSPSYLASLVLIFFARVFTVPYVLDVRDIYPQAYAHSGLIREESIGYKVFLYISNSAYKRSKFVMTATQGMTDIVAKEIPKSMTSTVYNGFPKKIIELNNVKNVRFTVCFHGALGFFQDVETLILVAKKLQNFDVDFVVIGKGRKQKLLMNNIPKNLNYYGGLPFDETMEVISKCHLGLCLRTDDELSKHSFPVKVWEYLGLSIPSIVTPYCEAGRFLEENCCGHQLNSGDVDSICSTIILLRDSSEDYVRLVEACQSVQMSYIREDLAVDGAKLIFKQLDLVETAR